MTTSGPASRAAPPPGRHLLTLDGLRGLAILMVLAHDYDLVESPRRVITEVIDLVLNAGWLGVQLFFVLSGFLITGILIDTRSSKDYWRTFLGRRSLRIFPLYYAVLFVAFVVAPLVSHAPAGASHQIWLWTYLANWAQPFGREVRIFPHCWSLCIEEQFYLFWPLVVRRLPARGLAIVSIALVLVAFASRVLLHDSPEGPGIAYTFTICRIDALVLGALAALAVRSPRLCAQLTDRRALVFWGSIALIAATTLLTKGAPREGVYTQTFGYTLFAVAFTGIVLAAALAEEGDLLARVLSFAPLRSVGRYSYAMYLFHTPLHLLVGLPLVERIAGTSFPYLRTTIIYVVLASFVTFLAGALSFHLFEKHFLALKRRFDARPS